MVSQGGRKWPSGGRPSRFDVRIVELRRSGMGVPGVEVDRTSDREPSLKVAGSPTCRQALPREAGAEFLGILTDPPLNRAIGHQPWERHSPDYASIIGEHQPEPFGEATFK